MHRLLLLFLLASCATATLRDRNKTRALHGEWRNTYLKITMESYKNGDTSKIVEATEENWEKLFKAQPVRTFFNPDGSYHSEHRDLKDSIFYDPAGKWEVRGDSIYMRDTFPKKGVNYTYWFAVKGATAQFRGVEDFDGDGKADDLYEGVQRKQ